LAESFTITGSTTYQKQKINMISICCHEMYFSIPVLAIVTPSLMTEATQSSTCN